MIIINPTATLRLTDNFFRAGNSTTAVAMFAAAVLFSFDAKAQLGLQSALKECAQIESSVARLDCYDALSRRSDSPRELIEDTSSTVSKSPAPLTEPVPETPMDSLPDGEEQAPPAGKTQPRTPAITLETPKQSPAADQAGQKYLRGEAQPVSPSSLFFTLVATYKDKQKRTTFNFDNGQVWRQIEPRYLKTLSSLPLKVELVKGALGSYSLRLGDGGRLVKVKRIK